MALGYDEAIVEMRKAQNLDPLSIIINADLAELPVLAHSYDESMLQSRKTIEMDPNFALAHNQLGQAFCKNRWTMRRLENCKKRCSCPRAARHG